MFKFTSSISKVINYCTIVTYDISFGNSHTEIYTETDNKFENLGGVKIASTTWLFTEEIPPNRFFAFFQELERKYGVQFKKAFVLNATSVQIEGYEHKQ